MAQVPYMDSTSESLSSAEREALPSLWAARSNIVTHPKVGMDTSHRNAAHTSPRASEECSHAWGVKTPLTAPPPPVYETPIYIPPGPKSEPCPPSFVKAPPTPPDSESWSCTTTSTFGSPQLKQSPGTLPGTMSSGHAQSHTPTRTSNGPSGRDARRRLSRMQRWKSAFKDMLTHRPVDDSNFEHIEARHWTDE